MCSPCQTKVDRAVMDTDVAPPPAAVAAAAAVLTAASEPVASIGWRFGPPYYTPFNDLFFRTTRVSRCQKGKTSLDLNEARDDGVLGCIGISWTICKQFASRCRQITTPTPLHSIFTGRMLFLTPNQRCRSTEGASVRRTGR